MRVSPFYDSDVTTISAVIQSAVATDESCAVQYRRCGGVIDQNQAKPKNRVHCYTMDRDNDSCKSAILVF